MNTSNDQIRGKHTTSPTKTLNWTLTKASLIAVIIGMSAYTFFEYATSGEFDTRETVIHHIIPTVFIGVIVWSMLNLILISKFVSPMKKIMLHLNGVGNGRLAPLKIDTNILEVGAIVHSVNTLTTQLKKVPDNEGMSKAVDDLVKLRADLKRLIDSTHLAPDQLVPIMRDLKNLESHLLSAITAERQAHTDIS